MDHDDLSIGEWPDEDPTYEEPNRQHGLRFGDGQGGSRSGRPPGSQNRKTIIRRVAAKRHRVKIDGRTRTKNTLDLVLRAIRTGASRGETAAFDLQEALRHKFGATVSAAIPRGVLILGEKLNTDEWLAVYGSDTTDQECEERFAYLLNDRRRFRAHQDGVEEQCGS